MFEIAVYFLFPALVVFGAVSDLITMKISNWLSVAIVAVFAVLALISGFTIDQWGHHLLALAVVFVPCFAFFAFGWMGGGDVKFLSAISLWIGFNLLLVEFAVWTAIFGTVLTVGIVLMRNLPFVPAVLVRQDWYLRLSDPKNGVPYGIAIAAAALYVYPKSIWFNLG